MGFFEVVLLVAGFVSVIGDIVSADRTLFFRMQEGGDE